MIVSSCFGMIIDFFSQIYCSIKFQTLNGVTSKLCNQAFTEHIKIIVSYDTCIVVKGLQ